MRRRFAIAIVPNVMTYHVAEHVQALAGADSGPRIRPHVRPRARAHIPGDARVVVTTMTSPHVFGQAAAYDLLDIEKDTFKYEIEDGLAHIFNTSHNETSSTIAGGRVQQREAVLDETDDIWVEFRHKHIATVLRFARSNSGFIDVQVWSLQRPA